MPSEYDGTEFVDADFQLHKTRAAATLEGAHAQSRAPTLEELDLKAAEAQQKLAELKRLQEELERQRAALEETRRRQLEFQTGRNEVIHGITHALGLLEEAEFEHRREAEQMSKAIADLRAALQKVEAIREETWTKENFEVELTKALTAIENARMELNAARLKFEVLSGKEQPLAERAAPRDTLSALLGGRTGLAQLCKLGLALTWPLVVVGLLALALLAMLVLGR
ncbi:MAG: hypothetical protein NZ739_06205 [Verrucomicrobiae bacterium]|nr:hypothetical protein [Verrucomicrobiae bacterium]MCX7721701.1 hypothetical protein [Verrucomicrobiae bacterium]MDW7981187.1 hypothetical protein [Verrucomicrobiales bacterium]